MLYIVGIGLSSAHDITLSGLNAVRSASKVYLENYTSLLIDDTIQDLEKLYGKPVTLTDRHTVENEGDSIIEQSVGQDIAFLVVGDPLGATTHIDLLLRCDSKRIPYQIIQNVSILNAIGLSGLSLYNFGQIISIPFFTQSWKPFESWLNKLDDNFSIETHTLCLLDIKIKEQSDENLARGRKIYEPPRFMTISIAIDQILWAIQQPQPNRKTHLPPPDSTLAVACCRLGSPTQLFACGSLQQLAEADPSTFGKPLHSLIILGKRLNPVERDFMSKWAIDPKTWVQISNDHYNCHS